MPTLSCVVVRAARALALMRAVRGSRLLAGGRAACGMAVVCSARHLDVASVGANLGAATHASLLSNSWVVHCAYIHIYRSKREAKYAEMLQALQQRPGVTVTLRVDAGAPPACLMQEAEDTARSGDLRPI